MKIKYLALIGLLLHIGLLNASVATKQNSDIQTDLEISQGYRRDSLTWNISGLNGYPNIISELKYKKIDVYSTRLNASISKSNYFAKALFGYGVVINGKNRDSDYLDNNRHAEFSRSHHKVTGDHTIDAVLKFGRLFQPTANWTISPSVGYGFYTQKFRFKHGNQDFIRNPFTGHKWGKEGKIRGLNSTYHAKWYSPQIGLQTEIAVTEKISLLGEYTFLYPLKYKASGFWNLQEAGSRHFSHHNKIYRSYGNIGVLGAQYKLTNNLSLKAEYELMKFYAKGGNTVLRRNSPVREAKRTASEVRLSLNYAF